MEYCYFTGSLQVKLKWSLKLKFDLVKLELSGKFKTNISMGLKWINEMD